MTLAYEHLYGFQKADVDQLCSHKSRLLGNEQGTGKTPAALILDQVNRRQHSDIKNKKTLVVTMSGPMIDVWDTHCMEWSTEDVYLLDPKNRGPFIRQLLNPTRSGYFVMHWEALRLIPELKKVKWFHIIADECQKMKNPKAQMTRAIKKIPAMYRTGASGTAADDKPMDLWSTLNWLWPRIYTSYWNMYNELLDWHQDPRGFRVVDGLRRDGLAKLQAEMKPWYTRRLKKDVLEELPPKYYTELHVELLPKQRRAYNEMKKTMIAWVERQIEDGVDIEQPMIAQSVVTQLVRLQQFAIGYMEHQGTEKVWDKKTLEWIDKDIWRMTEPSSKLDAVMDVIETMGGRPLGVFSQSKQSINLLAMRLEKADISHGLLTGDIPQRARGPVVNAFQNGELQVIACTIKSGGAGITLTRGSTGLFIAREWNQAWNKQAEDRFHRITQTEPVQIIDIIARNTVDLGRIQKLKLKWSLIQQLLGDIPWEPPKREDT